MTTEMQPFAAPTDEERRGARSEDEIESLPARAARDDDDSETLDDLDAELPGLPDFPGRKGRTDELPGHPDFPGRGAPDEDDFGDLGDLESDAPGLAGDSDFGGRR